MFGMYKPEYNKHLSRLEEVLDRSCYLDLLTQLKCAIEGKQRRSSDLLNVAIGIDTSVILRLASSNGREDIIDYLNSKHKGPIIVPSQTIQETWNNQLAVFKTIAKDIQEKYHALQKAVGRVDPTISDFSERMDEQLRRFENEYGYLYSDSTEHNIRSVIDMLEKKGTLHQVPRSRFANIAKIRHQTKTPPGFEDEGDGDFFIWADFLLGLQCSRYAGKQFDHAVLLTTDNKKDWSRNGIAHPILSAEVKKLVDATFEIWNLKEFAAHITTQMSGFNNAD